MMRAPKQAPLHVHAQVCLCMHARMRCTHLKTSFTYESPSVPPLVQHSTASSVPLSRHDVYELSSAKSSCLQSDTRYSRESFPACRWRIWSMTTDDMSTCARPQCVCVWTWVFRAAPPPFSAEERENLLPRSPLLLLPTFVTWKPSCASPSDRPLFPHPTCRHLPGGRKRFSNDCRAG